MPSEPERLDRHTLFIEPSSIASQLLSYAASKRPLDSHPTDARQDHRTVGNSQGSVKRPPRIPLPVNSQSPGTKRLKRAISLVPVISGSPWKYYKKKYRIEMAGSVAVAVKRPTTEAQFIVRSFSGEDIDEKLFNVRQLHHENVIVTYEIFACDAFYVVSEFMAISLIHLRRCPVYPDEIQLATISSQALNGLSFIASQGLTYLNITCSDILINFAGDVKIANLENCHPTEEQASGKQDVEAFGRIIMKIMDKKGKPNGEFGLSNPDYWSDNAVNFLSMTILATFQELLLHPFLKEELRKEELVWLVPFAQISANFSYSTE